MNLFDLVMESLLFEERKHDLGEGHAERMINRMTNVELLQHISDQLEYHGVALVKEEAE